MVGLPCILILRGVSSYRVVSEEFFERYTRVLMDARPALPIHFLKIYSHPGEHTMTVSIPRTHDAYVQGLVEHICTKIGVKFSGVSFEVCPHPTQRGAIIDPHMSTEDDFEVLDLVN